MYKVISTEHHFYPHVVLELQDTATKETKWWCYADFHDEDLCGLYFMILFISSSERYTDWTGTAFALSILPNVD